MSRIFIPNMNDESMIRIENAMVYDFDESVRASKFPMSTNVNMLDDILGDRQIRLAQSRPGSGHDNYLQGIRIAYDMRITVKALVEAERYHFLDIVSSTSTMHRIAGFDLNECYCKYVDRRMISVMMELIEEYNSNPTLENYLKLLYSNPCGFTYTVRFTTNYRQLKTIYQQRKDHRLPEWMEFCSWIETLPHADLIIGREEDDLND